MCFRLRSVTCGCVLVSVFFGGEHARALLEQTAEIRAKLVKNLALEFQVIRVFSVNVPPKKNLAGLLLAAIRKGSPEGLKC